MKKELRRKTDYYETHYSLEHVSEWKLKSIGIQDQIINNLNKGVRIYFDVTFKEEIFVNTVY